MTYNRNGGKLGEGDLRPKALFADSTQLAAIIGSPKAAFKKHRHMCGLIQQGYVIVMCEPQVFGLRADSSLAFFEISGFGRVRVVQNLLRTGGQAGIYVHTRT